MAIHVSINGYDSLEQIGVGGMAAVYKARKISIDKVVAVKVLFPYLAGDESFIERFQQEAKAAAKIQHENIVNVIDFGESDSSYFIVMEYYEGQTLEDILKTHGFVPLDIAILVLLEVCYGLESAHARDIVHRDIKPANIIYTNQGGIKIADFGLAKKSGSISVLTQEGKVIGTPAYMSPEQAVGRNVGHQSDVFSLGVVAYELLCQQKPFEGNSHSEVLEKIKTHEPVAPTSFNPLIQPDFERIVSRMLQKDPKSRYPSITDVITDIEKGMERYRMTRDRRRLCSYINDPDAYVKAYTEKIVARCLSQGAFYVQKGRNHRDEAILEFRRALHVDPKNERAKKNLEKITAEQGKERTQTAASAKTNFEVDGEETGRRKSRVTKEKTGRNRTLTVVAASGGSGHRRIASGLFGAFAAVVVILAALFGYQRGLPDLSIFKGGRNTPPAVSAPKRLAVGGGEKIEFDLQAVDAEGDSIRFYADELPAGARLDPGGGFVWRVEYGQTGSYRLKFYADDGMSATLAETIVEVQGGTPTIDFQRIGAIQVEAGEQLERTLSAKSSSGRQPSYELEKGPSGMSVRGNALVWKTRPDQSGIFEVAIRASDGAASETQGVEVRVRPAAQQAALGHIDWTLPETVDIYVDGALKQEKSRALSIDLPKGAHTLKAELTDGVTGWQETIDLGGGETLKLEAPEIDYGTLSVYFLGGVGELWVDGKPFREQPPFTGVKIPAGKHLVSCQMSNDPDRHEFEISIEAGRETIVEYERGSNPAITHAQP